MTKSRIGNFFYRLLCGAFLGISVIAPGISGSIMAVMMGIYDELIAIISNPFKNLKKNIFYLLPMGLGAVISILALIKALDFLFANYTIPAYLLFMSLILGSVPTVIGEARQGEIKKKYFIGTALAFAFALTIGLLAKSDVAVAINPDDAITLSLKIYLIIAGFVAGMMSMLPGMSVSMVLMMFGVYEVLLKLATGMMSFSVWFTAPWYTDILLVLGIVVAFLVGMVLFSNITKRVFDKHHTLGFLMVLGFMSGSIICVFPGLPKTLLDSILSVIAIALGVTVSYIFKILGKKFNVE